jgi:hypothetical protein
MSAKTIRTAKLGNTDLRLAQQGDEFYGLADGKVIVQGTDADDTWRRLHDKAGESDPSFFGFDGAIKRFLRFFPNGFRSAGFDDQERRYKLEAKTKLETTAPLSLAATGTGFGEAVLSAYRATNLLYPVEKTRLQSLLRGPDASAFVQAAASFANHESEESLRAMEAALKPHENAKWTVVTYLPYLWRPEHHMFLKPEVTKDFAARVGHPFARQYHSRLELGVYESLLDLVEKTNDALKPLNPRDHIDIQSFIWIVGDYREDRENVYE